ncbi:hypothetical protein [Streptomyces sp. H27-D2]|uniref:hypothetical protein n=1 Tax=Streptomyces sp. H27-D2 TaxID=3046304 RepID=UPI002DBC1FE8|nr:hypothetical protein [Streptomyces sp. H27-D2]MEC4017561.1 hypothetical protein [Streptomyces sp. H27-D2]
MDRRTLADRRALTDRRTLAAAVAVVLAATLATAGCGSGGSSSSQSAKKSTGCVQIVNEATGKKTGKCMPLAPKKDRVDLDKPAFSRPTSITNPLHPSSRVQQVIYGGQVGGKPFRTEFTLLPDKKTIALNGERVKVRTLQYTALSDGRIEEVALDWFAQADDGSVWYLGEDVFNYADGVVADTDGTWKAGRTGPAAMIMPAHPKAGDVYRPENAPEVVFEEVTVKAVGQTVPGPYGPVKGAVTVNELHMDGSREDKVFAPGYGEFSTGEPNGDLEAVSLAVPTDAKPGPVPSGLAALSDAVRTAHDESTGQAEVRKLRAAWDAYRASDRVSPVLTRQMNRDLGSLAAAVAAHDARTARGAALRVAQNDLDLHLRYEPLATVEAARMDLWARQLKLDAAAKDEGAVAGDVTSLELTWERVEHSTAPGKAERISGQLRELRGAADHKDTAEAAKLAPALTGSLAGRS